MNQEYALSKIQYYKNNPEEKNSQGYKIIQNELYTIRDNGVKNFISVMNYGLDIYLKKDNPDFHIPYDIAMMARKEFEEVHGGIPKDHAGESRSIVGFGNKERFLDMKEEFKAYELFAQANMNEARDDFNREYNKHQAILKEEKELKNQEQAIFEESNIYKYSQYIAYFFLFMLLIWTPLSMFRRNEFIFVIIIYLLLSLSLLVKKKSALYIYLFMSLILVFANGFSGILNLLFTLIFIESHYYNGRHVYDLKK